MERDKQYGHRKMVVWQNLDDLEILVQSDVLKHIHKSAFQLRDQIDRSCGSCNANFIEGYYSGSLKEYIRFLGYSKRSLAELQYWVRQGFHKNMVTGTTYSKFDDLAIKTMFLLNRLINALKAKSLKPS